MADQAITALPKKTYSGSSQIASTDYLLGIDSAEGYQMLIQDLGEYIINRVTASLAGSTQTLASAISALNSNVSKFKIAKFDVANISALETKLAEIAANYSNYDYTMVSFSVTSGGAYFLNATGYEGLLYKNSTGYLILEAFNHGGTALPVLGRCSNGTWVWDNLALNSKTPANPTVLTASDDMNNITTPGVYAQWNDNTPLHAPTTQYNATILVYNMRPYEVWQIWASANTKNVWTRMKAGGNWTDWQKQPTRAEMNDATVKTLTVTETADANGYIDTRLKYNQAVPLCVYSVTINGSAAYPFLYEFLMRGGSPAEKISVRIKRWSGEVYTGEVTFSMKYI